MRYDAAVSTSGKQRDSWHRLVEEGWELCVLLVTPGYGRTLLASLALLLASPREE